MITKEQFIENAIKEIGIVKHLFEKIPADSFEYRPSEKQRSTMELLQYLAIQPSGIIEVIKTLDLSLFGKYAELSNQVTKENFLQKMDEQAVKIKAEIEAMTTEQLEEEIDLWKSGDVQPRSQHLLQLVLEALVAYKMQLFLYIKASGNHDISTPNLWRGTDPAPKQN